MPTSIRNVNAWIMYTLKYTLHLFFITISVAFVSVLPSQHIRRSSLMANLDVNTDEEWHGFYTNTTLFTEN